MVSCWAKAAVQEAMRASAKSIFLMGGLFFAAAGESEDETESHAKESGEKDLEIGGKDEGDGVGGEPEERDGLFENHVPLDVPVDLGGDDFAHLERFEEAGEGAAIFEDVNVGALVEGHHDGSEDGVHGDADSEGDAHFAPGEGGGGEDIDEELLVALAGGGEEDGDAALEDHHGHGDAHAEDTPDDHAGKDAKALLVPDALADAECPHFAKDGEDGELEEGHDEGEVLGEIVEPIKEVGGGDEKWGENRGDDDNYNPVGSFHFDVRCYL